MKLFKEYRGLRKEIYILFIGKMMTNMGAMIWPMLTLILNKKLGMNASEIAGYFLLFSICSIPVTLLGGKLADHFNKKNLIIFCDCFSIVAYISCGLLPLSMVSVWIMFFASLFQSAETPAYDALIADLSLPKDRARAYSLGYLGSNLGLVLAPTIGGLLFENYLWLAFIINGLAIASSAILIFFFIKNISREVDTSSEKNNYESSKEGISTLEVIKQNKLIILLAFITAASSIVYSQFNYLMPLDLARVHGNQGAVYFGTITSVNCILVVIFTPLLTQWLRKVNEVPKLIIGEFLEVFGLAVFMLLLGKVWAYYLAITIFTFGEIVKTLASNPYLTKRVPASHRGRILSIIMVFSSLIAGIAQKGVGKVFDLDGSTVAWTLVLGVGVLTIVLEVWLGFLDKKYYRKLYETKN